MNEKAKRIEQILEQFRAINPSFPSGVIIIQEGTKDDPPDAIVGTVGIEVIDYVREADRKGGSKLRAAEKRYEEITRKAEKTFREKDSRCVVVSFIWKDSELPDKKQDVAMAEAVVQIVERSIPKNVGQSITFEWESIENTILENYLDLITITRLSDGEEITAEERLWSNHYAGWPRIGIPVIQQLIADKESDLVRYPSHLTSKWLVIVADGLYMSSTAILAPSIELGGVSSVFDSVYFLDLLNNKAVLLTA